MERQLYHGARQPSVRGQHMEVEISPSYLKMGMLLALSTFLSAATFLLAWEDRGAPWWALAFATLMLATSIAMFVRPNRLCLDESGFTNSGGALLTPKRIAWRHVTGFSLVRIRTGFSMVGFNYTDDAPEKTELAGFSRTIGGADDAIRGFWTEPNAALVDRLNAYRERALRNADAPDDPS